MPLYSWLPLRWRSFPSSNFSCSSCKKIRCSHLIFPCLCAIFLGLSALGSCHAGYFSSSMNLFSTMSRDCWNRCPACRESASVGSLPQHSWAVSARHGLVCFPWGQGHACLTRLPQDLSGQRFAAYLTRQRRHATLSFSHICFLLVYGSFFLKCLLPTSAFRNQAFPQYWSDYHLYKASPDFPLLHMSSLNCHCILVAMSDCVLNILLYMYLCICSFPSTWRWAPSVKLEQ